jgi:hypothetical protein
MASECPCKSPVRFLTREVSYGYAIDYRLTVRAEAMHVAYVVTTLLAAFTVGYAAFLNFVGAESVKIAADRVHVSQEWMIPFGILLASGALGLLVGLAAPGLGAAAGIGLVVYFICALSAHLRAGDLHIAGALTFLVLVAAALATNLAYQSPW